MVWLVVGLTLVLLLAPLAWTAWSVVTSRPMQSSSLVIAAGMFVVAWLAGAWSAIGHVFRWPALLLAGVLFGLAVWRRWQAPRSRRAGRRGALAIAMAASLAVLASFAIATQLPPQDSPVALEFPLRGGRYAVIQGGDGPIGNGVHRTIAAQRHALDIVRIDGALGTRARAIAPAALEDYASYGEAVLSPCDGRVARAMDGRPDSAPGHPAKPASGNWVWIECKAVLVSLQHMIPGTVAVREGVSVRTGQLLGRIGNSGWSLEPHLHIDVVAHRPGAALPTDPKTIRGVPVRFDGRILAINDVVDRRGK